MILIVAHDAGGAELVSSYARREKLNCECLIEGPARRIFAQKLAAAPVLPRSHLAEAVSRAEWVLCGTSSEETSDLEWSAWKLAAAAGKRSVAFLDHWVNYPNRFARGGERRLPDELWVADGAAEALAREQFPATPVRMVGNPYLQDVRERVKSLSGSRAGQSGEQVLYVTENIQEGQGFGYTDQTAIRFFLSRLAAVSPRINRLRLRSHWREPPAKYEWLSRDCPIPVEMSDPGTELARDLAESDIVAGCHTMAMVAGLEAGRRVVSCVPPGGRPPVRLPFAGIEVL